jgi:hypothetical protein
MNVMKRKVIDLYVAFVWNNVTHLKIVFDSIHVNVYLIVVGIIGVEVTSA